MSVVKAENTNVLWVSLAISSAFLMEMLDSSIIVSAIPAIAKEFAIEPLRVNLTVSLYLMMLAALIPASGWLADRMGAKKLFLYAMAAFMLTSLFASAAPNFTVLVLMRMLQGAAGALMTPVGRLLLIRSTRKEQLAEAIAWMSMPALIGPVLGPLVGGYIVTYFSWQWIFWVKIPFGVIGMWCIARYVPKDDLAQAYHFDAKGFLLCAGVLAAAQLLMEQLVHVFLPVPVIAAFIVLVPTCMLLYSRHYHHKEKPALDLSLLKIRLFRVGFWSGGLSRIGFNALPFLLQLQLQIGFGWTAAKAGWIVFIIAAGALLLKPLMRHVLEQFGFRATLFGNALFGTVTIWTLSLVTAQTGMIWLALMVFLFGLSRSLQFNTTNTLLFADIPRERQSASTALGGVGQQISMALGISVAAVIVAQLNMFNITVPAEAMSIAMKIVALITLASGFGFLKLAPEDGAQVSRHKAINQKG